MSQTEQVASTIEALVNKAVSAGVELGVLEQTLRSALLNVEAAQADQIEAAQNHESMKHKAGSKRRPDSAATQAFTPDMQLSVEEFTELARVREGSSVSDDTIKKIFKAFDTDGNGTVNAHEYLTYSLAEALKATELRAVDLFKQWDEDSSGCIDEREFINATKALGYAVPSSVASRLFRELDKDKSGKLEYKELGTVLNRRAGVVLTKQELLRYSPGGQQANRDNRLGKPVARDSLNYASVRVRTLPLEATLDVNSSVSVMEQLGMLLTIHAKTLIELFLDWDEDGNGGISQREFRRAITALGYQAPKSVINALFDELDADHDNWITFSEIKKGVNKFIGQKRVDSRRGGSRPVTSEGRMRGSSSKSSLYSLGSSASSGALSQKFKYSWSQDHSARWPYESYPAQRQLQLSLIRPPASSYAGLLRPQS